MQISVGNLGAVLGTQLYRTNTSPRYVLGHSFALGYLAANICVVSVLWWVLSSINKKRGASQTEMFDDIDEKYSAPNFQGDRDARWKFST